MNNSLKKHLQNLVAIPSITGDFKQAQNTVNYVHKALNNVKSLNIKTGSFSKLPYLLATTKNPNSKMLWFVIHLDVVPGPEKVFKLSENQTKYLGRGVLDMKGIAAAAITATQNIGDVSNLNIGLMFTTDEEIGGKKGAAKLAANNFQGAAVVVLDQGTNWVLQQKMKGILWLRIAAYGQAAHGSRPWLGHSATADLVQFLDEFQHWFYKNLNQSDPYNYYATLNIGKISGGEAANQVADYAHADLDIRFTDNKEAKQIYKTAQKISHKFNKIKLEPVLWDSCDITDTNSYWYKKTIEIQKTIGIKPGKVGEPYGHGTTDGRFFSSLNIPVITTRPPGGDQHSNREWVSKKGLEETQQLIRFLMLETKSS
jgi:succinyl-diaminopimelate desuccinylase